MNMDNIYYIMTSDPETSHDLDLYSVDTWYAIVRKWQSENQQDLLQNNTDNIYYMSFNDLDQHALQHDELLYDTHYYAVCCRKTI